MGRKKFDKDFKVMIVELLQSGQTAKSVSLEYNLDVSMIGRWRREYENKDRPVFTGNGVTSLNDHEKELHALRRELADVKEERDILKKAVNIFSRDDRKSTNS